MKAKVTKNKTTLAITAVIVVLALGLVINAFAQVSFKELVAKYAGMTYANRLALFNANDSEMIGAISTTTADLAMGINGLRLRPDDAGNPGFMRFDAGDNNINGVNMHYEVVDFAAATTTLIARENNSGREIYIDRDESYLKITGQPTTTITFQIGTSSQQFVNPYLASYPDGYSVLAQDMTVATNTPTSTIFKLGDYRSYAYSSAWDKNRNTTLYDLIRVEEKEWLTMIATTSNNSYGSVASSSSRLFDGTLYIKYYTFD